MRSFCLFTLFGGLAVAADVSYYRDIRPIVQRQCQGCHQPNLKTSNLDLTTYEGLAAGGKRGPAAKLLVGYLTGEHKPQMPIGAPPLPAEQIELFKQWIAAGAKDDTPPEARETLSLDKPISYSQPPVLTALAFSPDGKHLAVSGNREVLLLPVEGKAPEQRMVGLSERILSVQFSQDGSTLIAAGGTPARFGEVQIWNPQTGKLIRSMTLTGDTVFGASLSPDGKLVAAGGADNTVRILDVGSGKELHKIGNHENWVLDTVFGKDGKRIVSVGRDRAAKLTDTGSGAFLENVNMLRGELTAVARHPLRDVVVIGGEDRIPYVYLMDRPKNMKIADDTTMILKLERQNGAIAALAWSPTGKQIAVAGSAPEVTLYDAESGKRTGACTGHSAGIYSLAYSPDGTRLATGGFDGQVRIYDTSSCKLLREFIPVPIETASTERPQP